MSEHRCYYQNLTKNDAQLSISDAQELHHLVHVLRAKANEPIEVFNGKGLTGHGVIVAASRKEMQISLRSFLEEKPLKPLLVLACAIPKRSKFETIIEKCTELGVDEIIPLKTKRTEISGSLETLNHKKKRYEEVAMNACKQSKRSFLPKIQPIMPLESMLTTITPEDMSLLGCLQKDSRRLADIPFPQIKKVNKIYILIGPEGDFTDEETTFALEKGCIPITLGPNILKVETAAISTMAYLMLLIRS
jgi:16S rRNA (uracil1498-N3)-methyltransferase